MAKDEKQFRSVLQQNQIVLQDLQKKSRTWFFNQADMLSGKRLTPNKFLNDPSHSIASRIRVGELYFYQYDPKTKDTLPYWDKFPLVFPFTPAKGGFIGLNMHYLPYDLRILVFEQLYKAKNNKFIQENERLKISWEIIQGISKFPLAQACVKRYLYSHVKSEIMKVNSTDWITALLSPVQRFQKQSAQYVWMESRERMKK